MRSATARTANAPPDAWRLWADSPESPVGDVHDAGVRKSVNSRATVAIANPGPVDNSPGQRGVAPPGVNAGPCPGTIRVATSSTRERPTWICFGSTASGSSNGPASYHHR